MAKRKSSVLKQDAERRNYDAGDEPVRPLADPHPCQPETCAIEAAVWSDLSMWRCQACGWQTFDRAEAEARAAAAGLMQSANDPEENDDA